MFVFFLFGITKEIFLSSVFRLHFLVPRHWRNSSKNEKDPGKRWKRSKRRWKKEEGRNWKDECYEDAAWTKISYS